eukprot:Clim_evm45s150 gene=Clim_evmTU45s150
MAALPSAGARSQPVIKGSLFQALAMGREPVRRVLLAAPRVVPAAKHNPHTLYDTDLYKVSVYDKELCLYFAVQRRFLQDRVVVLCTDPQTHKYFKISKQQHNTKSGFDFEIKGVQWDIVLSKKDAGEMLLNEIQSILSPHAAGQRTVLVLPNLGPLIAMCGIAQMFRVFDQSTDATDGKMPVIFCAYDPTGYNDFMRGSMEDFFATNLLLSPVRNELWSKDHKNTPLMNLFVWHRRVTGRVLRSPEGLRLTAAIGSALPTVYDRHEAEHERKLLKKGPGGNANVGADSDPTAGLSFNLSLSEREKQQRDQTVLPYMKSQAKAADSSTSASTQESDSGGGRIIYVPDDHDEIDSDDDDIDL